MTTMLVKVSSSSYIRQAVNGGLPDRAPTSQANPVGNTRRITRQSGVRALHPKLNGTPWSTSMAVKRTPMSPSKSKGKPYG